MEDLEKEIQKLIKEKSNKERLRLDSEFNLDSNLAKAIEDLKNSYSYTMTRQDFIALFERIGIQARKYRQGIEEISNIDLILRQSYIVEKQNNISKSNIKIPKSFSSRTNTFSNIPENNDFARVELTAGLPVIITGLTGDGKTTLALNIYYQYMIKGAKQILFITENSVNDIWSELFLLYLYDKHKNDDDWIKYVYPFITISEVSNLVSDLKFIDKLEKATRYRINKTEYYDFIRKYEKTSIIVSAWNDRKVLLDNGTQKIVRKNYNEDELVSVYNYLKTKIDFNCMYIDYVQNLDIDRKNEKSSLDDISRTLTGIAQNDKLFLFIVAQISSAVSLDFSKSLRDNKLIHHVPLHGTSQFSKDAGMMFLVFSKKDANGKREDGFYVMCNKSRFQGGALGIYKMQLSGYSIKGK